MDGLNSLEERKVDHGGAIGTSKDSLSLHVTVEFEDVDSFHIAHHTRLIAYLERARLRLLASFGIDLLGLGLAPVVYELHLRFRKPARLMDQLEVSVFVREFDDFHLGLGYRVLNQGETLLRARSVIAFADLVDGTVRPLPDGLRRALNTAQHSKDLEERIAERTTE